MSGHSKWATIKRSKGKADAARGKLFSRLIKEITVAAKLGGGDADANPRLRTAVDKAKNNNMPNKNIDNAIAKGTGQLEGASYEEVIFEAFAPGGVAIMVECMTDNRNRTVAEIRHVITRFGGNLGSVNSVSRLFHTKGIIAVGKEGVSEDALMEVVLDSGADDMKDEGNVFEIITSPDTFAKVKAALEARKIHMESAEVTKVPETTVPVTGESAHKVLKLINALDELDDTQNVFSNFDINEEDLKTFAE